MPQFEHPQTKFPRFPVVCSHCNQD